MRLEKDTGTCTSGSRKKGIDHMGSGMGSEKAKRGMMVDSKQKRRLVCTKLLITPVRWSKTMSTTTHPASSNFTA
jgi:hypothetical protein